MTAPPASRWLTVWFILLGLALGISVSRASLVAELTAQKELTPESLLRHFADFSFELSDEVQEPETFLQRKRGDCDDFAQLAAEVLTRRGYKAKLVVVMMEGQTHVVCYVAEAHGFLDFNFRAAAKPVMESDGSLEDVAEKVAAYFHSKWHMASEVRYQDRRAVYVDSAFPTRAIAKSTDAKSAPPKTTAELATPPATANVAPPKDPPAAPQTGLGK